MSITPNLFWASTQSWLAHSCASVCPLVSPYTSWQLFYYAFCLKTTISKMIVPLSAKVILLFACKHPFPLTSAITLLGQLSFAHTFVVIRRVPSTVQTIIFALAALPPCGTWPSSIQPYCSLFVSSVACVIYNCVWLTVLACGGARCDLPSVLSSLSLITFGVRC